MNFSEICLATDFSTSSKKALWFAKEISTTLGIPLKIIHVFDEASYLMPTPYSMVPQTSTWLDELIKTHELKANELLKAWGLETNAKTELLKGNTSKELEKYFSSNPKSLIAVGSHGNSFFQDLPFGSTTSYLLSHCPNPILVSKQNSPSSFKKVTFATDLSTVSDGAKEWAKKLSLSKNSPIHIIHTLDQQFLVNPPEYASTAQRETYLNVIQELRINANHALEKYKLEFPKGTTTELLEGNPKTIISEYLNNHQVDFAILGSHGYTGLKKWTLGSVAEKILHHVNCAVLIIKR